MKLQEGINRIFPAERDIPEDYRLPEPVEMTAFLLNGELLHWDGPMQEVFSPVCLRHGVSCPGNDRPVSCHGRRGCTCCTERCGGSI